jgi:hypothetical protein
MGEATRQAPDRSALPASSLKPSARRPVVEDKRLKALGLFLMASAGACMVYLADDMVWPLPLGRFVVFMAVAIVAANLLVIGLLVLAAGCGATHSASQPERRRAAVLMRLALANALAPALFFAALTSNDSVEAQVSQQGWEVPIGVVEIALIVIAWRLWRRSRQYGALSAADAMARDGRPPIVYLRSFHDDGDAVMDASTGALVRRALRLLAPVTPEQETATVLKRLGPVVAIGKPGEPLPELGAARVYVGNDEWQEQVLAWMRSATLVVIRVGTSPGVLWELERALEHLPRQRLVLAFLDGAGIAPEMAACLAPVLGTGWADALPELAPRRWTSFLRRDPARRIGSLVCFPAAGAARTVPIRLGSRVSLDSAITDPMRQPMAPLRRAWREVFGHLELPWTSEPRSRATAAVLALMFGWLGAQWFYLGDRRRGWRYVLMIPLLFLPFYLSWYDALRFIWVDRSEFDARFVKTDGAPAGA